MKDKIIKSFKDLKFYEWILIFIMVGVCVYTLIFSSLPLYISIINCVSGIAGVICVFFVEKAGIANFVFAAINTVTYIIFLYYSKIYGTFFLELLIYFPMNFISLYIWSKNKDNEITHITKVKKLPILLYFLIPLFILIISIPLFFILRIFNNKIALLDSLTVGIGIIAIILQTFRYKEHYYLWLVNDVISIILYLVSFNLLYLVKKFIYLINAILGIINWSKLQVNRNKENR